MSIQDEINQRKVEMQQQSQQKQIEHQNGLKEAEKVIPQIAEFVKKKIVNRAAAGTVEKRGLFGRKKFVKVEVKLDQDGGSPLIYDEQMSKQILKWYITINHYPELCGKLANKLRSLGMSNVSVELWHKYEHCLYIYAELAMD